MRMLMFRSLGGPWLATSLVAVLASLLLASPAIAGPDLLQALTRLGSPGQNPGIRGREPAFGRGHGGH